MLNILAGENDKWELCIVDVTPKSITTAQKCLDYPWQFSNAVTALRSLAPFAAQASAPSPIVNPELAILHTDDLPTSWHCLCVAWR
jgi:hypothetical protein